MEYLLSPQNIQILKSFSLANTLLGFDFDGTLAPIESDPSQVKISEECNKYLIELNKISPLAIITGRGINDIKKLLTFSPKYIVGNHGIEGCQSPYELEAIKEIISTYKDMILDQFWEQFALLNIQLEDKVYSLSLHFRNSYDPDIAEQFLISNFGYFSQAKVTKGKMVINIVPLNGFTKGEAFMQLLEKEKAKFGFYIGDDITDEDVFIHRNSRLLTVRVGRSNDSHAKYYLKSQIEIIQVLKVLCGERLNKIPK